MKSVHLSIIHLGIILLACSCKTSGNESGQTKDIIGNGSPAFSIEAIVPPTPLLQSYVSAATKGERILCGAVGAIDGRDPQEGGRTLGIWLLYGGPCQNSGSVPLADIKVLRVKTDLSTNSGPKIKDGDIEVGEVYWAPFSENSSEISALCSGSYADKCDLILSGRAPVIKPK